MTGITGNMPSQSRLHGSQPAEESPRQPRVIAEDDPVRFGNHAIYIAAYGLFDNEPKMRAAHAKKGPKFGPFMHSAIAE